MAKTISVPPTGECVEEDLGKDLGFSQRCVAGLHREGQEIDALQVTPAGDGALARRMCREGAVRLLEKLTRRARKGDGAGQEVVQLSRLCSIVLKMDLLASLNALKRLHRYTRQARAATLPNFISQRDIPLEQARRSQRQ